MRHITGAVGMGFNVVVIGLECVSPESGVYTIEADGEGDEPDTAKPFDAKLTFSVEVTGG